MLEHLTPLQRDALDEGIAYIEATYKPWAIVASGSIIRGNADASSDFDLYVLHDQSWGQRVQRRFRGIAAEIFLNNEASVIHYIDSEREAGRPATAHMLTTGVVASAREPERLERLIQRAAASLENPPWFGEPLVRSRYRAACLLEDAIDKRDADPALAMRILGMSIEWTLTYWFQQRQEFQPRIKDTLDGVAARDSELGRLLWLVFEDRPLQDRWEAGVSFCERVLGTRGFFEWESMPKTVTDPRALKDRGWREVAEIDDALAVGAIDEVEWHARVGALIKGVYLAEANAYGQAGHHGDAASWEASRAFMAEAIDRSGTLLDVGCASGVLMESAVRWGAARGFTIEPHGLEIVPELAELARSRLPPWSDRIHIGNIRTWKPEGPRFDLVIIRPEYAPSGQRAGMIRHVMEEVVSHGGRLIVIAGTEEKDAREAESSIEGCGFAVSGRAEVPHPSDDRMVRRVFWIDANADVRGSDRPETAASIAPEGSAQP